MRILMLLSLLLAACGVSDGGDDLGGSGTCLARLLRDGAGVPNVCG